MDGKRIRCGDRMKMMHGQRRADLAGPEHQLQPSTTQQRRAKRAHLARDYRGQIKPEPDRSMAPAEPRSAG
jgi:hypothetical protein